MTTCARFRKFNIAALVTLLILASLALAQTRITPTASTLTPLAGKWTGTFTYVDTYDDVTVVPRNADWEISANDSGVTVEESLDKAFGLLHDDETRALAVSADGRKVLWNGTWWHISAARETPAGTTIVFEGADRDNDKSAHVRNALYIGVADSATLTRYVTYQGGGREFVRHQYRMGRVKGE